VNVVTQSNWLRGINAATGKATVIPGTVVRGSNLIYTKRGSLITVDGTKVFSALGAWGGSGSSFTGVSETPTAIIAANRTPASPFPLVVTLDFTGAWHAYDFSTNPPTALLTATSFGGAPVGGSYGFIQTITMNNQGSGYVAATTVVIFGAAVPPITSAAGIPVISGGQITGVTLTSGGSGYTAPPKIIFSDLGGGTGAVATAVMGAAIAGLWGGNLPFQPGKVPIGVLRLPQLFNVNNLVILCPGNDGIPVWANFFTGAQGTVGSNNYPISGAAHGILHQGFVWLWNTSNVITAVDSPSTLRMCELDANGIPDITNFPRINAAFIDANDGSQGQGCVSFTSAETGIAPTATLVLFKDYATYQVTGILRPGGGYAVTRAQTDMGCIAPRSIQFAPGFGIIRLTHLGVSLFDGANDKLISEEVRPYFFQQESDVIAMDMNRGKFVSSSITANPPMYVMAVPIPGILGNSRLCCYDLILKQWAMIDLPAPTFTSLSPPAPLGPVSVISTVKIPGKRVVTYMSDFGALNDNFVSVRKPNSGGAIRKWQDGDVDWDGVPIPWFVKPPPIFSKNPATPLYVRRTVLRAKGPVAPITASVEMSGVQNQPNLVTKTSIPLNNPSAYGSARYGSGIYGDQYPDLVLPFDVGAKGFSGQVKYSGTGKVELLAIDWHYDEKPKGAFGRVS
jgi:hypothetical protein